MKNTSILLKSIICGLVYIVMSLSIIFILYIMDLDLRYAFVLGGLCGIIIAAVTAGDTLKRTIAARFLGIISAAISQFLLSISGIPYSIIMSFYKDENWMREIGHLTINELIGYGLGLMIFWGGLLALFCISGIVIFMIRNAKSCRRYNK